MIVSRGEVLTFIGKETTVTAAEERLLSLVHPFVEGALVEYLQNELSYQQHIELLPMGGPASIEPSPLNEDFEIRGNSVFPLISQSGGSSQLQLSHAPVVLTGLEVREDPNAKAGQGDDDFGDSTILDAGSDYWLDIDDGSSPNVSKSGILHRNGLWPTEPRTVKVTYFGGVSSTVLGSRSKLLRYCAVRAVAAAFWKVKANSSSGGIGAPIAERIGKYSKSFGGTGSGLGSLIGGASGLPPEVMNDLEVFRNYGRLV